MKRLVADSGPLIIFARSGHFTLLSQIAGEIYVPQTVFSECTHDPVLPGAPELLLAKESRQLIVHADPAPLPHTLPRLDPGEQASLALALQLACPLLIDERPGRKAAQNLGLTYSGSAAVLLKAKRLGLLKKVGPVLQEWEEVGYFLGKKLKIEVLKKAGDGK